VEQLVGPEAPREGGASMTLDARLDRIADHWGVRGPHDGSRLWVATARITTYRHGAVTITSREHMARKSALRDLVTLIDAARLADQQWASAA